MTVICFVWMYLWFAERLTANIIPWRLGWDLSLEEWKLEPGDSLVDGHQSYEHFLDICQSILELLKFSLD